MPNHFAALADEEDLATLKGVPKTSKVPNVIKGGKNDVIFDGPAARQSRPTKDQHASGPHKSRPERLDRHPVNSYGKTVVKGGAGRNNWGSDREIALSGVDGEINPSPEVAAPAPAPAPFEPDTRLSANEYLATLASKREGALFAVATAAPKAELPAEKKIHKSAVEDDMALFLGKGAGAKAKASKASSPQESAPVEDEVTDALKKAFAVSDRIPEKKAERIPVPQENTGRKNFDNKKSGDRKTGDRNNNGPRKNNNQKQGDRKPRAQ